MASSMDVSLDGFKELEAQLKAFGPKLELSGLRSANYQGAKVIVASAKATSAWQDRAGALRGAIRAFRRSSGRFIVTHAVGVTGIYQKYPNTAENRRKRRVGKRFRTDGPGFYGRFLEFGTSRMQAHPWLRPAFLAKYEQAIDAIGYGMVTAIDRITRQPI
jgi:HK97 gp10 family phage protein